MQTRSPRSVSLRAVSVAALLATAALAASAQSTVTVYGLVDMYLQYGKGAGTQTQIQSGGLNGSRLGFKGTEDLGEGLKTIFQLEMGINADTGSLGQGGLAFGRQAYVGLQSSDWGTLSLGRQYTMQFVNIDAFDAFATGLGSGVESNVLSSTVRANNALVYKSPVMGGFSTQGMVSLGENATSGQKAFGNIYSLAGNYVAGPFSAALTLTQQKRTTTTGKDTNWALLSAAYDFGGFKVLGGVQWAKNLDLGSLTASGSLSASTSTLYGKRTEAYLGTQIPVSAKGTVIAEVAGSRAQSLSGFGAAEWSVGYTHSLSKRTTLYAVGSHINNGSATNWTTTGATGSGPATVAGKDVSAMQLGIRHAF